MTATPWYPRTVFFTRDVGGAVAHYVDVLGFTEAWRHDEEEHVVACLYNAVRCRSKQHGAH